MKLKEYDISAYGYLNRANNLLNMYYGSEYPKFLVYACLELRICIERILFEYLVLIHLDEKTLESFDTTYRTKDFKSSILETEPEFFEKLEFLNIYLRVIHTFYGLQGIEINIPSEVVIPNLDLLSQYYGKLGNTLHSLKLPEKTILNEKWNRIVTDSVFKSFEYLKKIEFTGQMHFKMNNMGYLHFEVYKSNELDDGELIKYMLEDFKGNDNFIRKAKSGDLLTTLFDSVKWSNI